MQLFRMSKPTPTIKVMVVDDHDLVRHGIKSLINSQEGIEVIAEASSGEEAIEQCRALDGELNIIMMDINMPGMGGMEATRNISKRWPELGIIIVTIHGDGPLPKKLLKGGAKGYPSKGNNIEEITQAIRDVYAGGNYIAKDIAQNLALSLLPGEENIIDRLSQRELQVLMMIAHG